MLFDENVIQKKNAALEKMSKRSLADIAADIARLFPDVRDINLAQRPWSPGGGSILVLAVIGGQDVFIKIKDKTLGVESRLEKEQAYPTRSALENEAMFCNMLAGDVRVPKLLAFKQDTEYAYEVFERLTSFDQTVKNLDAHELYTAYRDIEGLVRALFHKGIVHTDVHEKNILFRGKQAVLCDFEEARLLLQDVPFAQSLDVVGENTYGNVGEFPEGYGISGLTCLKRLRAVFKPLIKQALPALLEKCHFSNDCQFNVDELQGKDERIYQSIDLGDSKYAGQRPLEDKRHDILISLLDAVGQKLGDNLSVVDIGSNLGTISFAAARSPYVSKVIGLEAFPEYVQVAQILTLLLDYDDVTFEVNQAGVDPLPAGPIDVLLVFSVYHHVRNKDAFLQELLRHRPRFIVAEMAVQERYYKERGGKLEEELRHIYKTLGYQTAQIIGSTPDYNRPICIFHDFPPLPKEVTDQIMLGKRLTSSGSKPPEAKITAPVEKFTADKSLHYPVKVSIVLPTYNHATFLPAAINSILNQTFNDFELIIVNDGSTDQTAAMLAGVSHPKLRVVNKDNGGLPAALNSGFDVARGQYYTWTSADNLVAPTWLEELVKALDNAPANVGYALSSYAEINDKEQVLGVNSNQCFEGHRMLITNGNASFLYSAQLAKQVGPYDVALNGAEDLDMWLRMSRVTQAIHVESVLYYYRLHDDSMTKKIPDKVQKATRGAIEKYIAAMGGKLDVDILVPGITSSANPALARWQAKVWLAARLLNAPFCPPGAVVDMLVAALLEKYDTALVANIVHLFVRNNSWESASEVIGACQPKDPSPAMQNLADIVKRRDGAALAKIAFATLADTELVFSTNSQLSRAKMAAAV